MCMGPIHDTNCPSIRPFICSHAQEKREPHARVVATLSGTALPIAKSRRVVYVEAKERGACD